MSSNGSIRRVRRTALVAGLLLIVFAAPMRAGAADVETLRARAQGVADSVTGLEQRLHELEVRGAALDRHLATIDTEIASLEVERQAAEQAADRAQGEFVDAAVAVYKKGPPADGLALVLSAETLGDAATLAHAAGAVTEEAASSMAAFQIARRDLERLQTGVDARKQKLLTAMNQADAVTAETRAALADRRAILHDLTARINELEAAARAAAAAAAAAGPESPSGALTRLLQPGGPSAGIPDGYSGTGVTFEGIASWYGPGFEGNPTASGQIFDPDKFTAASRDLPLGTWLYVQHEGRGVVVLVNDRGPYIDDRILDLSQAAAESLGIGGLGWIEAEILIKL